MFDLSMQSALDIFCYVLVLIYGLALSADLSTGGHVSRQQKYLLTLLCLLFLLMLRRRWRLNHFSLRRFLFRWLRLLLLLHWLRF